MLMVPTASQELEREHGVSSDTPNEQLDQNFPNLHPDPRRVEEREDQETVAEQSSAGVPKYIFDSDQFDEDTQHTVRFMRSWSEY